MLPCPPCVGVGHSDQARAACVMGAPRAPYQPPAALVTTCEKAGIALTRFHGRGRSIGRGGPPAHAALLSQPPGSLNGCLPVTAPAQMIRFKYALPDRHASTLQLPPSPPLAPNLRPPPQPNTPLRHTMDVLSVLSVST
ncbi:phosphoenolpyruvate carboxylase, partial [Salmonella enterica]|uniref:phosphoenolpyruvate carboxylase n=1 Tax=Salmonella enterica TaxID=28901 RepID=UPI00398C3AC7